MQKANTAALLLAIALGATVIGCAPTDTTGEQKSAIDTRHLPMTADAGVTLPAGVLPPNNPPEPGDAPLGNDGHYNYDAPEFVLTNPCDDPEIMGRLEKVGFREQDGIPQRIKGVKQLGCIVESENNELLGLWHTSVAHSKLNNYNTQPSHHYGDNHAWVTFKQTNPIELSYCTASVETPKGALGFSVDITGEDNPSQQDKMCAPANQTMIDYLGEKS